ncbi:Phage-related protein, predicted endonuclease [Nitrosospira sp. Nsp11]|uniref:YqaJ viral recombinase family protein n=1 Tax=Nitrosospira sp. Nsp11 TaxID=1855338 RepID=UPI0009103C87|nr:YqaJ viral recombinase family protein [Nitrosospira sp. Nsp11]SHL41270.1 Phage-related protein, predicted endonuclease [Nitrosospira sp. Nsp11]
MQVHDLEQGSPEWHAHRRTHWNASDAPAMMGVSKYKTRSEFLHELHTGIAPEVDSHTQRRFDEGHRFENLARSLAEEIVGESLYPVTGTEAKHSASFDGLTMLEHIAYEHKRLNDAIRAAQTVADLDEMYHIQMEQQCLVSGAEKVLFLASNWDDQGNLLEAKHFWYEPDMELRERIIQGWHQFARDLADYIPAVRPEKPEAEAVMQLPSLSIQTSGQISIISNLDLFGQKLNEFVDGLDLEPTDDQGFANAEAAVKTLQKAQDALEAAEASALAQAADVDEMRRTVALYADTARKTRLMLERMVKARKEQIKEDIIRKAKTAFADHIATLDAEIHPIRLVVQQPDLIAAARNKRTLASLHDSVNTAIANAKIAADSVAKDVRAKLAWHKENSKGYELLFPDLQQIIQKPEDDFQMLVKNRIDQHKADEAKKLEEERASIRAEEQKKAEEKVRAEQASAIKPVDAPKPVESLIRPIPVKACASSPSGPSGNSALVALARHELVCFRKKFAPITELSAVMREIDSYLDVTQSPAEARRA